MHRFPGGMRASTLDERREFYSNEFELRLVTRWIGPRANHMKLAMIPGRHTGIVSPGHSQDKDNVVIIDEWESAKDIRSYALDYLPEGLYYDRNRYIDISECGRCGNHPKSCKGCHNYLGQQLAFDLDPENVDCPYHGHIGTKMAGGRGLSFCMLEFREVRRQSAMLASELRHDYDQVSIIFSGRGFHVVVDDDEAYSLTKKGRRDIARRMGRRYPIDEWVTEGGSRLMRLPYSLNGVVSRKCVIIKEEKDLLKFDPRTSELVLPAFARSA